MAEIPPSELPVPPVPPVPPVFSFIGQSPAQDLAAMSDHLDIARVMASILAAQNHQNALNWPTNCVVCLGQWPCDANRAVAAWVAAEVRSSAPSVTAQKEPAQKEPAQKEPAQKEQKEVE